MTMTTTDLDEEEIEVVVRSPKREREVTTRRRTGQTTQREDKIYQGRECVSDTT